MRAAWFRKTKKSALCTLKVLLGRSRHKLTNHPDRITEIGSSNSQVYEAPDDLSEPRRVAHLPGVRTKLHGSVQRIRDGLTVGHPEFEEHIQHVLSLADQYALGGTDHFDPEEVMKVPQILHIERRRKLLLYAVDFT